MQQKYEVGTRLTYFWHKNEIKISLNFIFVFEPLLFQHTYLSFLLSKLASQINLIQSVVGFSCYSQGLRVPLLGSHVPGSQVPRPKVPVQSHRVPSLRVSGRRVPGLRIPASQNPWVSGSWVPGPRSQVLILDYACISHTESHVTYISHHIPISEHFDWNNLICFDLFWHYQLGDTSTYSHFHHFFFQDGLLSSYHHLAPFCSQQTNAIYHRQH